MNESNFNNKLENDLGILKEIFMVVKLANKYCNKLCKKYNMTQIQFQTLYLLNISNDNGIKMSTLGHELGIGRSEVTVLVDKMGLLGLVKRHIDKNDRRITKVIITEEGRKIMGDIFSNNEILRLYTFDFMQPDEKELLWRAVEKIKENLENKMFRLEYK